MLHVFFTIFEHKMKIITFILSIFILSMSAMTCGDDIDENIFESQLFAHFDNHSHDHSQESQDSCTPFCTCQCCGTSITVPSLVILSEIKNTVLYSCSFHYTSLYSFDYYNGVWHPPTLS